MFHYHAGLVTRRAEVHGPTDCPYLLVQSSTRDPAIEPGRQLASGLGRQPARGTASAIGCTERLTRRDDTRAGRHLTCPPCGLRSPPPRCRERAMNDDTFNLSIRKFLKLVGVSSQREIEQAVASARESGAMQGKRDRSRRR